MKQCFHLTKLLCSRLATCYKRAGKPNRSLYIKWEVHGSIKQFEIMPLSRCQIQSLYSIDDVTLCVGCTNCSCWLHNCRCIIFATSLKIWNLLLYYIVFVIWSIRWLKLSNVQRRIIFCLHSKRKAFISSCFGRKIRSDLRSEWH